MKPRSVLKKTSIQSNQKPRSLKRPFDPNTKLKAYGKDLAKPSVWIPLGDPEFSDKFEEVWEEHVEGSVCLTPLPFFD